MFARNLLFLSLCELKRLWVWGREYAASDWGPRRPSRTRPIGKAGRKGAIAEWTWR